MYLPVPFRIRFLAWLRGESAQLERIERKLDAVLAAVLRERKEIADEIAGAEKEITDMNQQVQALVDAVNAEKTVNQSAVTLLNGIPKIITDAIAKAKADGGLDDADLAAVTQAVSDITNASTQLSSAVTANTPAAPTQTPPAQNPPATPDQGGTPNG